MFAVTQEDFVHPMAVIELLWRSCCASEAEKQESSLTTRLKVRQWTQMLVDHSLLLELANVEEGSYLKDNPQAAWPPQAAYTIATECGLLPITLTIAAQVVRSWGEGWGT